MAPRERKGPCGNPDCTDPDNASGQWQFIPDGFTGAIREGATCTCKKGPCKKDYFGLGSRGVKRPASIEPIAFGESVEQEVAIPYAIRSIDAVWGVRLRASAPLPAALSLCASAFSFFVLPLQVCKHQCYGPSGQGKFIGITNCGILHPWPLHQN